MKQQVDLIIVIPAGPGCQKKYVSDTIKSIHHYISCRYKIIIADDSTKGLGRLLKEDDTKIEAVSTHSNLGKFGGLYITLCLAYSYALEHYSFDVLLRMDTDALIIGGNPQEDAIELFQQNPQTGIAGQYPFDYNGKPNDYSWPRAQILKSINSIKRLIRRPVANFTLRSLYRKAIQNGYSAGENVFGGAYFMSESCLLKLKSEGLLPNYRLKNVQIQEDHLFGLLIKSIGMKFGDLASGALPFACAWKGLPDSPDQLCNNGKKIIHSVNFWNDINEDEIRAFFRSRRD